MVSFSVLFRQLTDFVYYHKQNHMIIIDNIISIMIIVLSLLSIYWPLSTFVEILVMRHFFANTDGLRNLGVALREYKLPHHWGAAPSHRSEMGGIIAGALCVPARCNPAWAVYRVPGAVTPWCNNTRSRRTAADGAPGTWIAGAGCGVCRTTSRIHQKRPLLFLRKFVVLCPAQALAFVTPHWLPLTSGSIVPAFAC